MRACWLQRFGGPEVLVAGDAPDPRPGPGEVVVGVEFANVSFSEVGFRATGRGPFPGRPPLIPGYGVGGVLSAIGAGVDPGLVGRRVVGGTRGHGAYAERVVLDVGAILAVPDGLATDAAVALLVDGRTATMLARTGAPRPGERVLITAAAGGVGTLLVQLARAAGATVIAAAGGARKLDVVRALGAEVAVDYLVPGWDRRVGAVDLVYDAAGGDAGRTAFACLRAGGRMVSFGGTSGSAAAIDAPEADARSVALVRPGLPTWEELRVDTERALADGAAGTLRPVIGQCFPLERAADAHAAIESRAAIGRTLLRVR